MKMNAIPQNDLRTTVGPLLGTGNTAFVSLNAANNRLYNTSAALLREIAASNPSFLKTFIKKRPDQVGVLAALLEKIQETTPTRQFGIIARPSFPTLDS